MRAERERLLYAVALYTGTGIENILSSESRFDLQDHARFSSGITCSAR